MNPYDVVGHFEQALADFTGSRFAVAVDSGTNALFLCCKYLKVDLVTIPKRTYVSVPNSIIHAGGRVAFEDLHWLGKYQLKPYPIYDSACMLAKGMYRGEGSFVCLSFSNNKAIKIGKGGMILHDDPVADAWFRKARYCGRNPVALLNDTFDQLGWNMYMTPEQAARGLSLTQYLDDEFLLYQEYPDLSRFPIFQTGE